MGEKDGQGVSGVSHGICQACYDKITEDMEIDDNALKNIEDYWKHLRCEAE